MKYGVKPNSVRFASTGTSIARGERRVIVEGVQRFGEDHVGAGVNVRSRPVERRRATLARERVRARHDDEVFVAPRIDSCFESIAHLFDGDGRLVRTMTAAFRLLLVFDVDCRDTGTFHFAHGARDVESAAETRVDVDEQR